MLNALDTVEMFHPIARSSIEVPRSLVKTYTDFEPLTARFIQKSIKSGDTFVDIGANIGYFAIIASINSGPEGRVFAFEPMPEAHEVLSRNLSGYSNCITVNTALGLESGIVDFYSSSDYVNSGTAKSPFLPKAEIKSTKVNQTTLDKFSFTSNLTYVDMVKCDIQGDDANALIGGARLIKGSSNPYIVVEWAPSWMKSAGHESSFILDTLYSLGLNDMLVIDEYKHRHITVPQMLLEFEADVSGKRFCNLIAARKIEEGRL